MGQSGLILSTASLRCMFHTFIALSRKQLRRNVKLKREIIFMIMYEIMSCYKTH